MSKTTHASTSASVASVASVASCTNVRPIASELADHSQEHARHLAQLRALPEVRAQRIVKVKQMIADGTFDTEQRLAVAIDRMLAELRNH